MMASRCSAVSWRKGTSSGNIARARESLQLLPERAIARLGPGLDRALVDGFAAIGNHEIEIEIDGVAEALAARAGAVGIVERKQARLGLLVDERRSSCTRSAR